MCDDSNTEGSEAKIIMITITISVMILFSKLALSERGLWVYVSVCAPHGGSGRRLGKEKHTTHVQIPEPLLEFVRGPSKTSSKLFVQQYKCN